MIAAQQAYICLLVTAHMESRTVEASVTKMTGTAVVRGMLVTCLSMKENVGNGWRHSLFALPWEAAEVGRVQEEP